MVDLNEGDEGQIRQLFRAADGDLSEPDPDHPVLVVTVRGVGFRLDNAW